MIELAGRNERIFVKEHEIKKVMEGGGLMSGKKTQNVNYLTTFSRVG